MKDRQVQLVLDQIVDRVFEGARLKLVLIVNHDHRVLVVVVVLEARHETGPCLPEIPGMLPEAEG